MIKETSISEISKKTKLKYLKSAVVFGSALNIGVCVTVRIFNQISVLQIKKQKTHKEHRIANYESVTDVKQRFYSLNAVHIFC